MARAKAAKTRNAGTATAVARSPEVKLPAALELRPYQQRWIDDQARFKLAVKSARIGFSFGTGIECILDCLEHPNTTWTVLSASKAQSVEFVDLAQKNLQLIGAVGQLTEEPFADIDGITSITQTRLQFPNGARIIALPANPRTARGYPGNAILDEFAHHQDSHAIFAAVGRQVALGHKLRVLSTPNGEQGKFHELAKDLDLTDGVAPAKNPVVKGPWSGHWVDIHLAIAEGCPISIEEMRALFKDEDTFGQEFLCLFLKAQGAWLQQELIATAEHDLATIEWPAGYQPVGPLYAGIDVARDHDATVLWIDEKIGDVAWTRMVLALHATPFDKQEEILTPWVRMTTRTAIDSTGMGVALYDYLNKNCPGKVMGINFAGTNDGGVKIKTDLAIRIKQNLEKAKSRIPRQTLDPAIRQELMAIKRESTSTGVKFDAPRIELETAVAGGKKQKVFGHADRFWAKALCDLAAESAPDAYIGSGGDAEAVARNERRGIMSESARKRSEDAADGAATSGRRRTLWD